MPTFSTYDEGSPVRMVGTFKDINGILVNPTTVIVRVKDPTGAVTLPAVENDNPGIYHADIVASIPGNYYYRFESTGDLVAVADAQINVTPSPVLE